MPIQQRKDGWYWGSKGPFPSRKKAEEVAAAAYASGYVKKWEEVLKKKSTVNSAGNYTKPALRRRLFNKIKREGKGGKPGQWSARKAQMLAQAYKRAGGGYRD